MKLKGLKNKIWLLISLPFLAFLFTISIIAYDTYDEMVVAKNMTNNIKFLEALSETIGSLQEERGTSATFLNGDVEKSVLSTKRTKTDININRYKETLEKAHLSKELKKNLWQLRDDVNKLRNEVDANGSVKFIIGQYSKKINEKIRFYVKLASLSHLGFVSQKLISIARLEEARDAAGKLRANLSLMISKNKKLSIEQVEFIETLKVTTYNNLYSMTLELETSTKEKIASLNSLNHWSETKEAFKTVIKKARSGNFGLSSKTYFEQKTTVIDDISGLIQTELKILEAKTDALYHTDFKTLMFEIFLVIGSLALLFSFAYWQTQSIYKPFLQAIRELNQSINDINSYTNDLSNNSTRLADASTEQASAVQEASSAMQEMSSMVSKTSDNAKESTQLVSKVNSKAENGKESMSEMVTAMEAIESSNKDLDNIKEIISEITKKTNIINDIVFKTQLLSFNAAIEAARAGQHGKGFAVVAEEVGNLAQLSGNAAEEIQGLLNNSTEQVEKTVSEIKEKVHNGLDTSKDLETNFSTIVNEVSTVSEKVGEIATACSQQETGIRETTVSIKQMDESAQDNKNISETTSNIGNKIGQQGQTLSKVTSQLNEIILGSQENKESKENQTAKSPKNKTRNFVTNITKKPTNINKTKPNADDDSFRPAA